MPMVATRTYKALRERHDPYKVHLFSGEIYRSEDVLCGNGQHIAGFNFNIHTTPLYERFGRVAPNWDKFQSSYHCEGCWTKAIGTPRPIISLFELRISVTSNDLTALKERANSAGGTINDAAIRFMRIGILNSVGHS